MRQCVAASQWRDLCQQDLRVTFCVGKFLFRNLPPKSSQRESFARRAQDHEKIVDKMNDCVGGLTCIVARTMTPGIAYRRVHPAKNLLNTTLDVLLAVSLQRIEPDSRAVTT